MPITTTPVYDTFWRFAAERQAIYMKRMRGLSRPWTADPILDEYKFTNAYRATDRVSQYLIRDVIYDMDADWSAEENFFRTILFKLFNRISTWELLTDELGHTPTWQDWVADRSFGRYLAILDRASDAKISVLGPAYIMPSGSGAYGHRTKRGGYLALLSDMMDNDVPQQLIECPSMAGAFRILTSYPIIGDFLGYQFVTDLAYTPNFNWSEMEFVVPGPGAFDGVHKCFSDTGGTSSADIIRMVTQLQEHEFADRGLEFEYLWGRPLQLIDVQNLFCEISKYARVAHPEIVGRTGRTKIKAKHMGERPLPAPWFPPKWGINTRKLEIIQDDG